MKKDYGRIVLGLLITILDIPINGLNILPDFLGYILITFSLWKLGEYHFFFKKAQPYSTVLAFLTIVDLIKLPENTGISIFAINMYSSLLVLLKIAMFYYITKAILNLARDMNMTEFYHKVNKRWKLYFFVNLLILYSYPFFINLPYTLKILVSFPIMISLLLEIIFIILIHEAGKKVGHVN